MILVYLIDINQIKFRVSFFFKNTRKGLNVPEN